MKRKQIEKAKKYFNDEVKRGEKKAIKIMAKDGFDGVNYQKVFAVDLDGVFASAPTPVTKESAAGQAKLLGKSATDFPTVALATSTTVMQNGGLIGIGVESSLYDVQKDFNAKSGFVAKEAEKAYQFIEEAHQSIAWGTEESYAKSNLLGFFTHPNIARASFSPNASGKTKWAEKSNEEIVKDIGGMVRDYFTLNLKLREGSVEVKIYMPPTLFDVLTMTKAKDSEKSVMQYLKKFLPENGFNVSFGIANALATKEVDYVAIGDFRKSTISYNLPLMTEGMETFTVGLTVRKNFIAESKGLTVEKENAAIIYEGA